MEGTCDWCWVCLGGRVGVSYEISNWRMMCSDGAVYGIRGGWRVGGSLVGMIGVSDLGGLWGISD